MKTSYKPTENKTYNYSFVFGEDRFNNYENIYLGKMYPGVGSMEGSN
jgi:hypothetical protein